MTRPRIAILGSFMQAVCWQLERLPLPGETLAATGFSSELAGKGLAVAVGCRRLGAEVDLLLSVGDDAAGDAVLSRLGQEGLPTRHVTRHPGDSGHGAGWLAADGSSAIAVFPGANARLDASQVARADETLAAVTLVYAQLESPIEAAREAFARASRYGAITVLNPSPWQVLDRGLLASTQVLVVNESESALLMPGWQYDPRSARHTLVEAALGQLWAAWPGGPERQLVVTLGAIGSVSFSPVADAVFAPANAVNNTGSIGAGDAFSAGLCTALSKGYGVTRSLTLGNACGAFAVSHSGILDALPFADDVAV
ncbi:PfkB family carbohydrate kinase [Variovorax sp. RHLX14]|uniref:PfkB family carbohydrate kinase n=1 Tax=Variovorax sp. RHLX14 TaxID=1259731 RepID=UPI003F47848B